MAGHYADVNLLLMRDCHVLPNVAAQQGQVFNLMSKDFTAKLDKQMCEIHKNTYLSAGIFVCREVSMGLKVARNAIPSNTSLPSFLHYEEIRVRP